MNDWREGRNAVTVGREREIGKTGYANKCKEESKGIKKKITNRIKEEKGKSEEGNWR